MRWGVGVVLLLLGGAVWLLPGVEPKPADVVALPFMGPELAPRRFERVDCSSFDMPLNLRGASFEPVFDVQFTLLRDGGTSVGDRITLGRGRELVGGASDVRGVVTVPLTAGEWRVGASFPTRVTPDRVVIAPDAGVFTLTLAASEDLRGCVVDEENHPVRTAVHVRVAHSSLDESVPTRSDGCFSMPLLGQEAAVWVANEDYRSTVQYLALPGTVRLRAARLHRMSVELQPESVGSGMVSVWHRLGVSTGLCAAKCSVFIPSGRYELRGAALRNRRLQYAAHSGRAPSRDFEVMATLGAAPPITGVVRDAAGAPLEYVTLSIFPVDVDPTDPFAFPKPRIAMSRVGTRADGSFSVTPDVIGRAPFPVWRVEAGFSWSLSPVEVSLGDKPLNLTAEWLPPDQRQ